MRLPQEFASLETWCERWCLADSNARSHARTTAKMADIQAFYDAMAPAAEAALQYLSSKQLGALSEAEESLLKLLLALAEIGPAVEWFGQPRVIDGYDESKFPLVQILSDSAAQ
ncbi:MAG: hypothetical protein ACR2PZ_06065 [Pseudomonadales bacterium]